MPDQPFSSLQLARDFLASTVPSHFLRGEKEPRVLLVGAHSDDEFLGAFTWLSSGLVKDVWFPSYSEAGSAEMTNERWDEARACAEEFNYRVHWANEVPKSVWNPDPTLILVPSPTEKHPHHRAALRFALRHRHSFAEWPKSVPILEYSIEKHAPYVKPLPDALVRAKEEAFHRLYPSQRTRVLDPKYILFEGTGAVLGGFTIVVKLREIGFHHWPDAPAEVGYLRSPHRHVFDAEVRIGPLYQQDRELEYHLVQRELAVWYRSFVPKEPGEASSSCEEIASKLAQVVFRKWGASVTVRVMEDGENGSEVSL